MNQRHTTIQIVPNGWTREVQGNGDRELQCNVLGSTEAVIRRRFGSGWDRLSEGGNTTEMYHNGAPVGGTFVTLG